VTFAQPGGFVLASNVINLDADPYCVFCYRSIDTGQVGQYAWLHVLTSRIVCGKCLPDPSAKDGQAGERMAERLVAMKDEEYEVEVW
jgi:hypothetical protein